MNGNISLNARSLLALYAILSKFFRHVISIPSILSGPLADMISQIELRLAPEDLLSTQLQQEQAAKKLGVSAERITQVQVIRRSIDARKHPAKFNLICRVWVDEVPTANPDFAPDLKNVSSSPEAIVVGFGSAGLFAALRLIELNIKPIVLERGKTVRDRRHDIARVTKQGEVDPDSNYCFGEGGAGTFSDGKLYTRATKRGSVERILQLLTYFGADPDILVDAHPHIGTNKLPQLVEAMRKAILDCGGEVHFNSRVSSIERNGPRLSGVRTTDGRCFRAPGMILATGHSARDIYYLLQNERLALAIKPFALGVRAEHPQTFVDQTQYHCDTRPDSLPPASYALRHQASERGVFSFCMCPGGIICPAATADGSVVVNGWSPSKRNSRFANSGIVVEIRPEDLQPFASAGVFAGLKLQEQVETAAALVGGGKQIAPAQRLSDFVSGVTSSSLPECSYIPGLRASNLSEVLPAGILSRLQEAFRNFDRQMKGYIQEGAVVVAVESRTSSPLRIPRVDGTLMHPELEGLFPCAEGAGFAGGIVSAAMDGERVAAALAEFYRG